MLYYTRFFFSLQTQRHTLEAIISLASAQIHRIRRGTNQHQISHADEIQLPLAALDVTMSLHTYCLTF